MSVPGSAGGRNFASANRVLRKDPCPAIVPSAIDSWLLAQVVPINLFSAHVRSQADRCASDDRETCTYWTLAPGTGHHPPRGIWTYSRLRHEGLVFRVVQD